MVTIEQKLALFSNLLHRSMGEAFKREMEELRKEFEARMDKNREEADKEAERIVETAEKRAEAERTELLSRKRVEFRKEYMSLKEKYFSALMERIRKELGNFAGSDGYTAYIKKLAARLASMVPESCRLEIYLAGRDLDKYMAVLEQALSGTKQADIVFRPAEDDIIGGFIAYDMDNDIRIDMSLRALLEDNRPFIMQTLFQAIETGDQNGL
ncbi:MAG TPA: V-type ATP synthase subunit E [Clostridia bacterium]